VLKIPYTMVMYVTLDKGTMFGGKSSALCKLYIQYMKQKRNGQSLRILIVKHAIDDRYDGEHYIVTHDGKKIPCIRISHMRDIAPDEWDVLIIDEGQFFPDLYQWLDMHFQRLDTRVHIAGLNGDKRQRNFGDINLISPFCSREVTHYAMCAVCGEDAPFTKDRSNSSDIISVGGDNKYYTVCHRHLNVPASDIEAYVDYSDN